MRNLDRIILHCSATEEGKGYTVDDIRRWHVEGNGWADIGYHFVIELDGTIKAGRDIDVPGSHVRYHNGSTIGVCYVGGLRNETPADTMTMTQEMSWIRLVTSLRVIFGPLKVHGHNEFAAKACPSFDVQDKYGWMNTNP